MKSLFKSEQNKANRTFGVASSSCAFSVIRVLGTVLAVSIIIFAIISHSVISISIFHLLYRMVDIAYIPERAVIGRIIQGSNGRR